MEADLLDSVLNMLLQGAKDDQIVQQLTESGLSSVEAAEVLAQAYKTLPVARARIIAGSKKPAESNRASLAQVCATSARKL